MTGWQVEVGRLSWSFASFHPLPAAWCPPLDVTDTASRETKTSLGFRPAVFSCFADTKWACAWETVPRTKMSFNDFERYEALCNSQASLALLLKYSSFRCKSLKMTQAPRTNQWSFCWRNSSFFLLIMSEILTELDECGSCLKLDFVCRHGTINNYCCGCLFSGVQSTCRVQSLCIVWEVTKIILEWISTLHVKKPTNIIQQFSIQKFCEDKRVSQVHKRQAQKIKFCNNAAHWQRNVNI